MLGIESVLGILFIVGLVAMNLHDLVLNGGL